MGSFDPSFFKMPAAPCPWPATGVMVPERRHSTGEVRPGRPAPFEPSDAERMFVRAI
jgi:hypothetical protein